MQQRSHLHSCPRRARAVASVVALALLILCAVTQAAVAQHHHEPAAKADSSRMPDQGHGQHDMMTGPLGVSHVRMGSGTSWMPDSSPMHATHKTFGDWTAMVHGVAFGMYDDQGSTRGDRQLGIVDWEMVMLMRQVGTGRLHLHAMASLEPATIGARGYPLLLQTGESYGGQPLHDRQHPHDFIMELAAMFQQPITDNLAIELYGGPAGEPALGPVAFMHRPSAQNDPLSPLGHHWQDATHISYGVVTAGIYSHTWKLEGSWFNGREPDEKRWDIDLGKLDSYSGRLSLNPTGRLSVSGWYGYLASPEALHPDASIHRYGASVQYGGKGIAGGAWGSMLLWGANAHDGLAEHSIVAESNLEIGEKNAVFARGEYVRKSAEDLVLPSVPPEEQFDVKSLVAGYVREIASIPGGSIGIGGRASVNLIPRSLEPFYGTRTPAGLAVYVRLRPTRMAMAAMDGMSQPMSTPMPIPMSMPMQHDTTKSAMPPGMAMPATEPHPTGHEMPGMQMRDLVKRDTTMQHEHHMPGMAGMKDMPAMNAGATKKPAAQTKAKSTTRKKPVQKKPMRKSP